MASRTVRRAEGERLRNGYAPKPRRKCVCRSGDSVSVRSGDSSASAVVALGVGCVVAWSLAVPPSTGMETTAGASVDSTVGFFATAIRAAMALDMIMFRSGG
eukprot:1032201-Pleurochrysis_carterae.AAC.1